MKIANDNPKLSFLLPLCHSCESRNPVLVFVACKKEKTTTLDPRLQTSRMTEGESKDDRRGEGEDDRKEEGEDDGKGGRNDRRRKTKGEGVWMTAGEG